MRPGTSRQFVSHSPFGLFPLPEFLSVDARCPVWTWKQGKRIVCVRMKIVHELTLR